MLSFLHIYGDFETFKIGHGQSVLADALCACVQLEPIDKRRLRPGGRPVHQLRAEHPHGRPVPQWNVLRPRKSKYENLGLIV